jgi:hypothetical protein
MRLIDRPEALEGILPREARGGSYLTADGVPQDVCVGVAALHSAGKDLAAVFNHA